MSELKRAFEAQGYVVLRGLLTREEADRYRAEIQRLSGVGDADFGREVFECPDGVSKHRQFWPLIAHERLLPAIREIIGPTARYTQHSDLHAHRTGGWHRDSACRTFGVGPDWDESRAPYRVTRVAFYLQSYAESGSALGVVPGSHRYERPVTDEEWARWQPRFRWEFRLRKWRHRLGLGPEPTYPLRAMTMWTRPDADPAVDRPSYPLWIRTEPGDCILFSQRLYHCASPIRGPKYAIYLSYSPENEHARNHMAYYRHARTDLGYGPLDPELVEALRAKDLFLDAPEPAAVPAEFTVPA